MASLARDLVAPAPVSCPIGPQQQEYFSCFRSPHACDCPAERDVSSTNHEMAPD